MRFLLFCTSVFCPVLLALADDAATLSAQNVEFFEKRVRPFLVTDCYECHGAKQQLGGLRVDWRDGLLVGGDSGAAIFPGDAKNSLLLQSIDHSHEFFAMPKNRPKLSAEVIQDIAAWIDAGAADPRDRAPTVTDAKWSQSDWESVALARSRIWSFQPLQESPPVRSDTDGDQNVSTIDSLIRAELTRNGLQQGKPAKPEQWLRRVHFAITGLPPSPEELTAFLADSSQAGREAVVDSLLASPHFGERWARHWMDLVRYAETYGHEQDFSIPNAWRYRDYLIRAFNQDVPFTQLLKEHIAGDLLPNPRLNPEEKFNESIIGTGYWFMHQATHSPVDAVQDEADRIDNQIDVFSKAFLGLTVACARCHDHKFDAISTRDYYALSAYLRATRQDNAFLDPNLKIQQRLQRAAELQGQFDDRVRTAVKETIPLDVPSLDNYLLAARDILDTRNAQTETNETQVAMTAAERRLDKATLGHWVEALDSPEIKSGNHPLSRFTSAVSKRESHAESFVDTGVNHLVKTTIPASDAFEPYRDSRFADWFPSGQAFPSHHAALTHWSVRDGAIQLHEPNRANSGLGLASAQGVLRSPAFRLEHDYLHLRYAAKSCKIRLVIQRYQLGVEAPLLFEESFFVADTGGQYTWKTLHSDMVRHKGQTAYLELIDEGDGWIALDRVAFSDHPLVEADVTSSANLKQVVTNGVTQWLEGNADKDDLVLINWMLRSRLLGSTMNEAFSPVYSDWQALEHDFPQPTRVLCMAQGNAEPTHVFERGNPKKLGEPVSAQFLQWLPKRGVQDEEHIASGDRLALAETMASESNPLTHRVFVNRVWAHLFGRGIVSTLDNFGAMGTPPSHPQLLDELTARFLRDGASLKRLIRSICLTDAFGRSSAKGDAQTETRDPENILLHRQNLQRLEAEAIRDSLLFVAGELNDERYGPSVPVNLTPFMGDSSRLSGRGFQSGPLDGAGKRSIYQEVRRNFLSPFLTTFDFPIPDSTMGKRNSSNVPGQALTMMNDPFVRDRAEAAARLLMAAEPSVEGRLNLLFKKAFTRLPTQDELAEFKSLVDGQCAAYGVTLDAGQNDERVWTDVCHVAFMMKEFIYVR